jgi:hypothetical protein
MPFDIMQPLCPSQPPQHARPSIFESKDHSWYKLAGHIARAGGRLKRCLIQELVVLPLYGIVFNVVFWEEKKKKRKKVSAATLLATNLLWIDATIVSDDEDDDCDLGDGTVTLPGMTTLLPGEKAYVSVAVPELLPELVLGNSHTVDFRVSEDVRNALAFCVDEVCVLRLQLVS